MHYEFANRLAARGHSVTVAHWVPSRRRRFGIRRRGVRSFIPWFTFAPGVRTRVVPMRSIPRAEVCIATSWRTAEAIPANRRRFRRSVQIVYDYEFWASAGASRRAEMRDAFRLPDVSVATSSVVADMLEAVGRTPDAVIPCAIDHAVFRIDIDPKTREPVVGFIARDDGIKRVTDAVRALGTARAGRAFRVVSVGAARADQSIPAWVERLDAPDDDAMRAFYNSLSVFVLSSDYEGWGLPAAEAMACGAAVVSTRSGGVEDFAADSENALLVPRRDTVAMAASIVALLEDADLRSRLVAGGAATVAAMQWEDSVDALEAVLVAARP